jgi:hypothetical protein
MILSPNNNFRPRLEVLGNHRWAITVSAKPLKRLHQEDVAAGKTSTFESLKAFFDPNNLIATEGSLGS